MNDIILPPIGRLGNAIFRYLAAIILYRMNQENIKSLEETCVDTDIIEQECNIRCITNYEKNYNTFFVKWECLKKHIKYKKKLRDYKNVFSFIEQHYIFTDDDFINLINNRFDINILKNKNLILDGFYQINDIYVDNKKYIIDFINNHKDNLVCNKTEIGSENINIYDFIYYESNDVSYDYVIHIRLEDFVKINEYIKVEFLLELFETIDFTKYYSIAIVCNKLETIFEFDYIKEITDWFANKDIKINFESNELIRDFEIMKNAKVLVCSLSTISWMAAYFSTEIELCYFPDYNNNRDFQTFINPINNVIYYNIY